jgi:hypothetical protein
MRFPGLLIPAWANLLEEHASHGTGIVHETERRSAGEWTRLARFHNVNAPVSANDAEIAPGGLDKEFDVHGRCLQDVGGELTALLNYLSSGCSDGIATS